MTRYAIYFVPAPGAPLATFGARAIGYDCASGETVALHDDLAFRALGPERFAQSPSRYGFHATLKAPFELAPGAREADLQATVAALAAALEPVELGRLAVRELGSFIALTPTGDTSAVDRLAAACVEGAEALRAPLTEADRARRLAANLTPRQQAHVDRWGYPYVFEEFRFHMTLTGSIADAGLRAELRAALARLYGALDTPRIIDALTLCRQPGRNQRFRVLSRHPLTKS